MPPFFYFCVRSVTEVCFGDEATPMYGGGTVNISLKAAEVGAGNQEAVRKSKE